MSVMTDPKFKQTIDLLVVFSSQLNQLDLKEALNRIEHSISHGALLDPTLYRAACPELMQIERLVRGGLHFQNVMLKIKKEEERKS